MPDHEDLNKSLLKTPLNPEMADGVLEHVATSKRPTLRVPGSWKTISAYCSPAQAANGEPVTVLTLVSPQKQAVIGHYLYNRAGKMTASTEVRSFQQIGEFVIPKEMLIIWYDERIQIGMEFEQPAVERSRRSEQVDDASNAQCDRHGRYGQDEKAVTATCRVRCELRLAVSFRRGGAARRSFPKDFFPGEGVAFVKAAAFARIWLGVKFLRPRRRRQRW